MNRGLRKLKAELVEAHVDARARAKVWFAASSLTLTAKLYKPNTEADSISLGSDNVCIAAIEAEKSAWSELAEAKDRVKRIEAEIAELEQDYE